MPNKLEEKHIKWIMNKVDFFAITMPKLTILALLGHIKTISSEMAGYRQEIDRLRALVDEKARDERRMFEASERLQDNIVHLQRELKEAREHKKVALPREVAETIESFWSDGDDTDCIVSFLITGITSPRLEKVRDYAALRGNGFNVISALVNGYTVEQSKEERLRIDLQELFANWQGGGRISELAVEADRLLEKHFSESID